jgi:hypothetical protein
MADNADSMVGDIQLVASSIYLLTPITLSFQLPTHPNYPLTLTAHSLESHSPRLRTVTMPRMVASLPAAARKRLPRPQLQPNCCQISHQSVMFCSSTALYVATTIWFSVLKFRCIRPSLSHLRLRLSVTISWPGCVPGPQSRA